MPDKLTDSEIVKAKAHFEYGIKCDIFQEPVLSYAKTVLEAFDEIKRLKAENERLKELFEHSQANYWNISNLIHKYRNKAITAKAEAYKEFAERLKKTFPKDDFLRSTKRIAEDIDNLLKELVREQPPLNDVKCKDCEYLEFELPYAVCSKAYKGIVAPDDSCGKGKLKELVGEK